ncbi:MAG: response regulator [Bacilli bacterium]|nr:response regulator [Bacilli bacterium]
MRVIIVDDEIQALQLFLSQIVDINLEYRFFKDDKQAIIDFVKKNEVSGAFLDINMPNINGLDLAKQLINVDKAIKIVFVTGTNIKLEDLPKDIADNVIDIVYKPFSTDIIEKDLRIISKKKPTLKVTMFGSFDCFINNHLVQFSSSKSKELFALLLTLNGKSLTMSQAITYLWPDKDLDKAKILYRDAVWRLRNTLEEIEFQCVDFQRALLVLNKSNIKCDYFDFLEGKKKISEDASFLSSYDWSFDIENEIYMLNKNR